ncbi:hypothetical protein B0H13DRAFT_2302686 [Mycena leptocephala]|nr:hypothetical protein B0H13DRAFT_2302686 [Mycena leptocephala]
MPAHKEKRTNVSGLRNQGSNRSSPAVSAPSTAPPSPSPEPAGPLFGATPDQSDSETATDDEEQCTMFESLRNDWEAEERALTNSDIDSELGSDADWDMDEEEGLESMKALARQVDPTNDGEWLPPKQVRENQQKRGSDLDLTKGLFEFFSGGGPQRRCPLRVLVVHRWERLPLAATNDHHITLAVVCFRTAPKPTH